MLTENSAVSLEGSTRRRSETAARSSTIREGYSRPEAAAGERPPCAS